MTADIILPVTTPTPFTMYMAQVAIRTIAHTVGDYGRVWVLHNNTPSNQDRQTIQRACRFLGVQWEYIEGPYSNSKFWNYGMDKTSGELIAWANQDCIYYPGWCEWLVRGFYGDKWDALWPYSFHTENMGLAYRTDWRPEEHIIPTHHPATLLMLRRSLGFRWNEILSFWEMDRDFMAFANDNKLRTGLCLRSRVDHFSSAVTGNIDFNAHFGESYDNHSSRARQYIKDRYGA